MSEITDINCRNCFCSQETFDVEPAHGRNAEGEETESEELFWAYCYCYAQPEAKLISEYVIDDQCPGVLVDPEFYKCAQGRWWRDGKWVRWTEAE